MALLGIILLPFFAALAALAWPDGERRPWLLPAACAGHSALTLRLALQPAPVAPGAWLSLDPLGLILLVLASVLFLGCSTYALEYLRRQRKHDNRLFTACFLFMLSTVSMVAASRHLGLLWVAMEGTTLSAAPLIYFKRSDRSLEATWKYLIMGSVGIGLALLGTFFLALAAGGPERGGVTLHLDALLAQGPGLSAPWLKGAFIFILIGYGTKMGLSPLHTWLPDAHGESPSVVSALLSGVLLNIAFLGILRAYQVCLAAGLAAFAKDLLILTGLLSLATAAVFVIGQKDFKRLLAYSSVENMGLLALGLGVGGAGVFAALLHLINNALAKGLLFLTAGNIYEVYGDKTLDHVHGALRRLPISAGLFLLGFAAITGSPPFAPFVSGFAILRAAVDGDRFGVALGLVGLPAVIFIGMATTVLSVVYGAPKEDSKPPVQGDAPLLIAAPLVFMAALVVLGLWLPGWLTAVLGDAAKLLDAGAS